MDNSIGNRNWRSTYRWTSIFNGHRSIHQHRERRTKRGKKGSRSQLHFFFFASSLSEHGSPCLCFCLCSVLPQSSALLNNVVVMCSGLLVFHFTKKRAATTRDRPISDRRGQSTLTLKRNHAQVKYMLWTCNWNCLHNKCAKCKALKTSSSQTED